MLHEGKQALLNTVATALDHIMTSPSNSQVMPCHFLYDFKNCFNLLPHEGELKAGLGGLLCSKALISAQTLVCLLTCPFLPRLLIYRVLAFI